MVKCKECGKEIPASTGKYRYMDNFLCIDCHDKIHENPRVFAFTDGKLEEYRWATWITILMN